MARYLTVVFKINDEDSFKEQGENLRTKMQVSEEEPWCVSAMSLDDEITRLDLIEQSLLLDDSQYVIGDIFDSTDIGNKTLDDFL